MFDILKKTVITDNVIEYVLSAPKIAAKALPGQFILLRVDEEGERVPSPFPTMTGKRAP